MSFDSGTFWILFAIAWILWWQLPFRASKRAALFFSLLFYAWWSLWYVPLIVISAVVDFTAGAKIHATDDPRRRKRWLQLSLVTNLGLLGFFKYGKFTLENIDGIANWFGYDAIDSRIPWVVPVGISFYTFQTLSYSIDIYRRRLAPSKSFWDFFLFVSFFPQLVAGPIVRAQELLPQLVRRQRPSRWRVQHGLYLIVWGLFTKVVVADNLAPEIARIFALVPSGQCTPTQMWLGLLYLGARVFADFAGYSALAIGLASLLGLRFPKNFHYPYMARGPQEFWLRWHITLGSWLRDYLYIPLGGSRKGEVRTQIALMTTMVAAGVWHGAAWPYFAFGVYHGLGVCANRLLNVWRHKGRHPRGWPFDRPTTASIYAGRIAKILLLNLYIHSNWVFFMARDMGDILEYWRIAYVVPFTSGFGAGLADARHLWLVLPVVLMHFSHAIREWIGWRERPWHRVIAATLMIAALIIVRRSDTADFFYFQF